MTREETDALRREVAALVFAAIYQNEHLDTLTYERAAEAAAASYDAANAFLAEDMLHAAKPEDDDDLDPRAFDPQCTHGRKQSEDCPDCARELEAAEAARMAAAGGDGESGDS